MKSEEKNVEKPIVKEEPKCGIRNRYGATSSNDSAIDLIIDSHVIDSYVEYEYESEAKFGNDMN